MGKKDGSTSACYLWRFTEVWEMLMWLTFIYNMFRNGPHVHILPSKIKLLRLNGEGGGKKKGKNTEWYWICFAVQEHTTQIFFFFFWGGVGGCELSVTLVEDFFHPTIPSLLSKYLSLCTSVPRWRSGEQSGAFVLPECLSPKCELFHGLAEQRFI